MPDSFFKNNAIGFLRYILALMVVIHHGSPRGYNADPLGMTGWEVIPTYRLSLGCLAVTSFFFLSGMLITRSWVLSVSWQRFLWHRFIRIFPGFWVCLFLTAMVLCAVIYYFDHGSFANYFHFHPGDDGPYRYMWLNAFLEIRQPRIYDVFANNPYPLDPNISLWTLKPEFACYVLLMAYAAFIRRSLLRFVAISVFFMLFMTCVLPGLVRYPFIDLFEVVFPRALFPHVFARYWMLFFMIGSAAFVYRSWIILDGRLALGALVLIALAAPYGLSGWVLPFALPYLLLWLANNIPLTRWDRRGDLSYGIYIYGFPVQQTLCWSEVGRWGPGVHYALAILVPHILAFLSWTIVEKPALALRNIQVREPWVLGRISNTFRNSVVGPRYFRIRKRFFPEGQSAIAHQEDPIASRSTGIEA